MENSIENARRLVSEFDAHLMAAFGKEVARLEQEGDVEALLKLQECGVDSMFERMHASPVVYGSFQFVLWERSAPSDEDVARVGDTIGLLCGLVDERWLSIQRILLDSARGRISNDVMGCAHAIGKERSRGFDFDCVDDRRLLSERLGESIDECQSVETAVVTRWRVALMLMEHAAMMRKMQQLAGEVHGIITDDQGSGQGGGDEKASGG